MTAKNPPPGSAEAIQIGCSCSVLDACRFCGSTDSNFARHVPGDTHSVNCRSCGTSGPKKDTREQAIAAWNARLGGDEAWVTENDDGSISLDPYAGWPRQQLKAHCRKLSSALSDWQFAAWSAATCKGNLLANVPEPYRAKIESLIDAYSDSGEEAERYKQGELSDGASHE